MTAERSALLAHHFARSDDRSRAVDALLRAGTDAERLPSYRTAADFYRRAWEIADTDGADEHFRRATLSATFGLARLGVLFGWPTAAEARRAAHRARELAEALGDTEAQAAVLYFLGVISTLEGEFERGIELAEKAVAVAEGAGLHLTSLRLARGLSINYAFDG